MSDQPALKSVTFRLEVEDGWPPVGLESLPFTVQGDGSYRLLKSPLFIGDLSVGDDIVIEQKDADGAVMSWRHAQRSGHTNIWLLRLEPTDEIAPALGALRALGCNTTGLEQFGCYAIDVPADIDIAKIDDVLSNLPSDAVAIAYPSMRHEEPT